MLNFGSVFLLLGIASAFALDPPIRNLKGYQDPSRESLVKVTTAKVAIADYELLKHDFPQLRLLDSSTIDLWLLERAGYISLPQALNPSAAEIQSSVLIDRNQLLSAHRPESYRRGIVFDVSEPGLPGLLDGKGFGARDPRPGINSNGLMPLSDAVRELIWQNAIHKIFEINGGKFTTVRTYAVIDWGFGVKNADGSYSPAGAVLRQGHAREHWNFNSNLSKHIALEIELLLRKYGITSAGLSDALRRQAQLSQDLINIQGRAIPGGGAAVVDFGTFVRVPNSYRFARDLAVRENIFNSLAVRENTVGGNREVGVLNAVLAVGAPGFVEQVLIPDAVPPEFFGVANSAQLYPEFDAVSTGAARLLSAAEVRSFVQRTLSTLRLRSCLDLLTH